MFIAIIQHYDFTFIHCVQNVLYFVCNSYPHFSFALHSAMYQSVHFLDAFLEEISDKTRRGGSV